MSMFMRNHELVDSGAYSYGFAPEVDAWREDLVSSLLLLSLSSGCNPSVRFSDIIPTVGAVQTLSVVGTRSSGRSVDRRSKGEIIFLRSPLGEDEKSASNIALSFAPSLATQKGFKRGSIPIQPV
ncbi:hypothetical protein AYI68_g1935 [Smittium mucronatum]|uniref:Uncharacterized protein n=1 Tax=Smittium mucronatum TaxID=133383 RepID=A0A1R0H432_9FUNG|nr:hypothetical protein AYI68_g1935 [Smittium mucronatum]